jgi:hypothetical protein
MSVTDHEKIRLRAFQIWEAEGRPEGMDLEHWQRAEFELSLVSIPKKAKPSGVTASKTVAAKKSGTGKAASKAAASKVAAPKAPASKAASKAPASKNRKTVKG